MLIGKPKARTNFYYRQRKINTYKICLSKRVHQLLHSEFSYYVIEAIQSLV